MSKRTQCAAILALLRERGSEGLTPIDALNLVGSFRLGARIWDLRQEGYDIETQSHETPAGARVARYVLREVASSVTTGEQLDWWTA